jgi:hypothetical protein
MLIAGVLTFQDLGPNLYFLTNSWGEEFIEVYENCMETQKMQVAYISSPTDSHSTK